MAGRHAALTSTGQELTIRDLETPGGTFVNQQRLLAGQTRRLAAGDVIQLGGVQLRVKHASAAPSAAPVAAPPVGESTPRGGSTRRRCAANRRLAARESRRPPRASGPSRRSVRLAAGARAGLRRRSRWPEAAQCRTWDDFLVLAAQSWPALRDELTSGRLAELSPADSPARSGSARRSLRDRPTISSTIGWLGFPRPDRALPSWTFIPRRCSCGRRRGAGSRSRRFGSPTSAIGSCAATARVEPPGTRWVALRPEHDGRPFQTIDQTDLPVELELPETIDRPLIAQIVIESNGGTRRIGVRIERPAEQVVIPESAGAATSASPLWREQLQPKVAGVGPAARIAIGCAVAVATATGGHAARISCPSATRRQT